MLQHVKIWASKGQAKAVLLGVGGRKQEAGKKKVDMAGFRSQVR